jgi:hypothetical protein
MTVEKRVPAEGVETNRRSVRGFVSFRFDAVAEYLEYNRG